MQEHLLNSLGPGRALSVKPSAEPRHSERPDPPLLMASTLLVPGYIDENDVREIARFIALQDRAIPYALLAFSPQFLMTESIYGRIEGFSRYPVNERPRRT